ncbi:PREDICTED: transcription initiation factor TFIID subunit 7-like isoform X1 [Ipomoea nil]|uniref:transcription initiation factor TFIID subunit 7-like isoform X1 n=1 Tax=Ipomoea nil TaxID=35883 RepID=UPI000901C0F8|nr:PREDICTED: transcription initiation factor TFIID subunit 7-like isoform X1 [Ipomoea nil]XP_019169770.1 PREDICTED: transcription initiation factor TFIID subunit 7-like isoform X1 [Ipomoea nil]XP_019169771.1 PREDICTED: transcription initiation factor TFIID subunit 7-like isoform X1 [Ipomoea nil]XP_019169772.1 PREDICTED: transcription initiation factor TFIID subunit 7-like isoform X1 [Ipomoea nil]XP_019169773.1 PREDICTED: transcription initiation factor TFIID subunit 7-like isoform X1 [Ipomoea 
MEEQFILRVPPSVAEQIDRLLSENASSSEDKRLDLSFSEDGRTGTFVIGNEHFPAALLDLPCTVESYKTYDDSVLIKTADIGQMIMVGEEGDPAPDAVEYRHGLTPPMRDARRRRFRRELDLNPELVKRVEKTLQNIMAGGTAENIDILQSDAEVGEQEEDGEENARNAASKKAAAPPKPNVPEAEVEAEAGATGGGEPERSESEESDDSI